MGAAPMLLYSSSGRLGQWEKVRSCCSWWSVLGVVANVGDGIQVERVPGRPVDLSDARQVIVIGTQSVGIADSLRGDVCQNVRLVNLG